jgi:predicted dehydrogenase
MTRRVRVAVIGHGRKAEEVAAVFRALWPAELRRPQLGEGEALQASYDEIVRDDRVDAVVLAAPEESQADLAWQALAAGKHVLVTGPLARNADTAMSLVELSERVGRCLLVAHPLVFHDGIRKLRELVELGRLGEIYTICSTSIERRASSGARARTRWRLCSTSWPTCRRT